MFETVPYDQFLMDCQMPVMNGFEVTARIRDPLYAVLNHQVPIIAMTPCGREVCFGVHKDWPVLIPILNKSLAQLTESEESLMLDKWLKGRLERLEDWSAVVPWTATFLMRALVVTSSILFWNRRTRRSGRQNRN